MVDEISRRKERILIVDDNKVLTLSISKILIKEGYETDVANDGRSALHKIRDNEFDLILLDIIIPDIDGFEVCREIKSYSRCSNIPIIFISALEDESSIYSKGFELGVMDFLRKPFTTDELIFKIKNYLRLSDIETKLRESELLLRRVVNEQNEFVVRYKPDGKITFVNGSFCHYLNRTEKELIGSNFFDQLNVSKSDEIRTPIIETGHRDRTNIVEIFRPDREKVWHQWIQRTTPANGSNDIIIQAVGRDITESRKQEDILKRYEYIFKHAGWGISTSDPESLNFELVNETYAKMHGYTIEELKGENLNKVFSDKRDENIKKIINRVRKKGNYLFKSEHKRKNGEKFPALSNLSILNGQDDKKSLLISNVQDITELERANNALAESEERFRTIFVNTPEIAVIVRLKDLVIVDVNDGFTESTDLGKEEVIGKPGLLRQFFADPIELSDLLAILEEKNVVSNANITLKTPDGHFYPVLMSCSKISLNGVAHIVVNVRNIEDIRLFQESLQKSETKYRLLADYNYNWEFWLGPDGKYIYVSPSCERLTGFKPKDFEECPGLMMKIIHPEYKEFCRAHFEDAHLNSGPEVNIEFLIIDRFGNEKWISHNSNAVFDENGIYAGRRGNNSDITQRKISELELHKLSTAIEQSSSAVVITDTEGCIEYVNPYFEKLTGYKYKEVIGRSPSILKSGKTDPRIYSELWDSISSGKIWQGEFINRKRNNELYVENAIITPVKDKNSRIVNYIAIKQDVTRQREIDRKIMQTIISTEEKERRRIAQNLHDDLGPLLSTAKLYIKSLENSKDQKNKQIAIDKSLEAIDESLLSIKEIAYDLSPHILKNFGLISGIYSLINKINDTGVINIELITEIDERFSENIESSTFRVISELINNTIKHANAKKITITMSKNPNELIIDFSDDGIGFNFNTALEKRLSNGLSNIINRIKSLGGEINFKGNSGTQVSIIIQLNT